MIFRNHNNILIYWSRNISDYYQCWKPKYNAKWVFTDALEVHINSRTQKVISINMFSQTVVILTGHFYLTRGEWDELHFQSKALVCRQLRRWGLLWHHYRGQLHQTETADSPTLVSTDRMTVKNISFVLLLSSSTKINSVWKNEL